MNECGFVRPTSSGLFTLLPLARRALHKLEALICTCIEEVDGQNVSLPSLTAAKLWEKTGRLQDVGAELMKVEDRHRKKYLLAPTHEEGITELLADVGPLSYKQLPLLLYQISNKYRDEHRPKHGLLRAREFSMLDAYGLHSAPECASEMYERVNTAYRRLFTMLDLPVFRVQAPSGDMGGSLSHEWQLRADAGEDTIKVCPSCSHATLCNESRTCDVCGKETEACNSIEVGHTFILGTRYSVPLEAQFVPPSGAPSPLVMSCYGIGITRLLAACLEALSSEQSLRWPRLIAPYTTIIIGPKEGSKEWSSGSTSVNNALDAFANTDLHSDVLIDDRHSLTIGKRMTQADRLGYPNIIVCGKTSMEYPPRYEVYSSGDTRPTLMTLDELVRKLTLEVETEAKGARVNKL